MSEFQIVLTDRSWNRKKYQAMRRFFRYWEWLHREDMKLIRTYLATGALLYGRATCKIKY